MITKIRFIALFIVMGSIFSSCTKDSDVEYPTLTNIYFSENFDDGLTSTSIPTGWKSFNVEGNNYWTLSSFSGDGYAILNGFSSYSNASNQVNSWLISPQIDMDNVAGEQLSFQTSHSKYVTTTTNVVELYVSTNFDGTNYSTANWKKIDYITTLPDTKAYTYVKSGAIDLSKYTGKIHFAFKYIGVPLYSGTYQIDNVRIVY